MKQYAKDILLNLSFFAVSTGRFFVPGHELSLAGTYEAFAHIWVGWVMAAWYFDKQDGKRFHGYAWALASATMIEIVMFMVFRSAK